MYLNLSFRNTALYNGSLADGEVFISGFSLAHQLTSIPLDSPCGRLEFRLYKDNMPVGENSLTSDFARNTAGHTHNASYDHVIATPQQHTLRDYIDCLVSELAKENSIPKETIAIQVFSKRINGSFQGALKFRDGELQEVAVMDPIHPSRAP